MLVDEGHSSHGGENHERMRKALPNAAFIAFTGTPLLKDDKTQNKFGPILHAYTMQRAVEDGTVTPLLYEERRPQVDINETGDRQLVRQDHLGALRRAEGGPEEEVRHARQRLSRQQSHRPDRHGHCRGLLAQLEGPRAEGATGDRQQALRHPLQDRRSMRRGWSPAPIIISPPDTREGHEDTDEEKTPEVQKWWAANVGNDPEGYEKRTIEDFGPRERRTSCIVVDKLLTGFDEPRNTVLYIDKYLKDHNLLQAIARVNRLHEAKKYGYLVDYRGILKELDTSLTAYQDLAERTQGGFDIDDLQGIYANVTTEYKRLPGLHAALWAIFAGVKNKGDREQFRRVLVPDTVLGEDGSELRPEPEGPRGFLCGADRVRHVPETRAFVPRLLRRYRLRREDDRDLQEGPEVLHRAAHPGKAGRAGDGRLLQLREADQQSGRQTGRSGSTSTRRRASSTSPAWRRKVRSSPRRSRQLERGEGPRRDRRHQDTADQNDRTGTRRRPLCTGRVLGTASPGDPQGRSAVRPSKQAIRAVQGPGGAGQRPRANPYVPDRFGDNRHAQAYFGLFPHCARRG